MLPADALRHDCDGIGRSAKYDTLSYFIAAEPVGAARPIINAMILISVQRQVSSRCP
jgi:hypothetical protein